MSRPKVLDDKLLDKIVAKVNKPRKNVANAVSKKAGKLGISPEAALVLWARELGIGASNFLKKLDPAKQAEVRDTLPVVFAARDTAQATTKLGKSYGKPRTISARTRLKAAIEYLISDPELRERCSDTLRASKNFDRPINQATLVLEDRIRRKSNPPKKLVGVDLVNFAVKADPSKTVLKVSNDAAEQRGYADILRGVVLAFRNLTHHHVVDTFSREEALRICGFIDVLIKVIDNSTKVE